MRTYLWTACLLLAACAGCKSARTRPADPPGYLPPGTSARLPDAR
jgi:hypothetical protein